MHMCIYMCVDIKMYLYVERYIWIHTYMHACVHAGIHTYLPTYTNKLYYHKAEALVYNTMIPRVLVCKVMQTPSCQGRHRKNAAGTTRPYEPRKGRTLLPTKSEPDTGPFKVDGSL